MRFEKTITVPTSADKAWAVLMDIPTVGLCVPGVESIEPDGQDAYRTRMKVKVGAIRVNLDGRVEIIDTDNSARTARLSAQGRDKRVGGAVNASVNMSLTEGATEEVHMSVVVDAAVLGKLGEIGQAVMLRKADQVITEFSRNLARELSAERATREVSEAAPALGAPDCGVASGVAIETEPQASRWFRLRERLRGLFHRSKA